MLVMIIISCSTNAYYRNNYNNMHSIMRIDFRSNRLVMIIIILYTYAHHHCCCGLFIRFYTFRPLRRPHHIHTYIYINTYMGQHMRSVVRTTTSSHDILLYYVCEVGSQGSDTRAIPRRPYVYPHADIFHTLRPPYTHLALRDDGFVRRGNGFTAPRTGFRGRDLLTQFFCRPFFRDNTTPPHRHHRPTDTHTIRRRRRQCEYFNNVSRIIIVILYISYHYRRCSGAQSFRHCVGE